jgi:16S rRNA processing protein RimM
MVTKKQTGSPDGGSVYLAIGFLRRPHGVGGEIIMDLHTDFPERIKPGKKVYVGVKYQSAILESVRPHGNGLLVKLPGYDTPESAGRFRNQWVYVKSDEVPPLSEGKHYKHELIGLNVITEDGDPLGALSEIIETGANDVYVVRNVSGKEILLPAIPSVILERDMEARTLKVHLLDGLIQDDKS